MYLKIRNRNTRIYTGNFTFDNLIHSPIEFIKDVFREIKYASQRAIFGYSALDITEIDTWFMSILPYMLREYNKNSIGYPYDLIPTEWHDIVERIAFLLDSERMISEENELWNPDDMDYDGLIDYGKISELDKIHYEQVQEGVNLFAKYFRNLWW